VRPFAYSLIMTTGALVFLVFFRVDVLQRGKHEEPRYLDEKIFSAALSVAAALVVPGLVCLVLNHFFGVR
jgi:hypothetical protein